MGVHVILLNQKSFLGFPVLLFMLQCLNIFFLPNSGCLWITSPPTTPLIFLLPSNEIRKGILWYHCRKELAQPAKDCYSWKGLLARMALGQHLGTWIWGEFPPFLTIKYGSLCLNYLCKQYGLCCLPVFLLKVWNFEVRYVERTYMTSPR